MIVMHSIIQLSIVICCLVTTEAFTGVMLDSTLKQSSLCPGEEFTTFICTASGTDVVWVIGGRPLSFNRNANVGTSRTDSERNVTAILMRIDNPEDNGYAVRFSVLTVSVQPQATEMLSIKCHNGSDHLAKKVQYFPRIAGRPALSDIHATLDDRRVVANISWTAPINNEDLNYYAISVDDGLPMQTRNTSILYNLSSSNSELSSNSVSLSLRVTAVDRCGQQGSTAENITMMVVASPENELVSTSNRVKKDCAGHLSLIILLSSYVIVQA